MESFHSLTWVCHTTVRRGPYTRFELVTLAFVDQRWKSEPE